MSCEMIEKSYTEVLANLAERNTTRQTEWANSDKIDLAFKAMEFADEMGEMIEAYTELRQSEPQDGGKALELFKEEVADTVICLSLIANEIGIDLQWTCHRREELDAMVIDRLALKTVSEGLLVAGQIKKVIRGRKGILGTTSDMDGVQDQIRAYIGSLDVFMMKTYLKLSEIVPDKFNKTSEKYGCKTKF